MTKHRAGSFLFTFALGVAALGGVVALVIRFTNFVEPAFYAPLTVVLATVLGLLFLVMLFDTDVRFAVNAANADMKGGNGSDRYFRWPSISLLDPVWGLFGSRLGSGPLTIIRIASFAGFLLMVLVNGAGPPHPALAIAGCSFGITVLLSMFQLKTHYPRRTA
jgi:hypothetical protein